MKLNAVVDVVLSRLEYNPRHGDTFEPHDADGPQLCLVLVEPLRPNVIKTSVSKHDVGALVKEDVEPLTSEWWWSEYLSGRCMAGPKLPITA